MIEMTTKEVVLMQPTLFGDTEYEELSIDEVAQQMSVSSATIRNWIKTGYLIEVRRGRVSTKSLCRFCKEVAGREKLNSRANKSLKDSHDHTKLSLEFLQRVSADGQSSESLGSEYEASLSDSYKNKEGIYYTPSSIVADLFSFPGKNISSRTFCDPCCGSGNFIMRAIDLGFRPENVHGYDTDPVAVALTKKRIFERTDYKKADISVADFFNISATQRDISFDYIYTNPPWGKKISKLEKEYYGSVFHAGNSIDTCSLFFFACLNCLKKNGKMGLLLPESFFNIAAFASARIRSLGLDINRLISYGKPFKGLVTKATAIVLTNRNSKENVESISCEVGNKKYKRSAMSFANIPKSIFNFQCDRYDLDVIDQVFSIPHITLEGNAKWGLGIVTGNNKKFSRVEPAKGYMPVYKGSDIKKDRLLDPSCYIPEDTSLYQQVAPLELFQASGKLIYKFISSNLCFFFDTKQRYLLNSANMLVPSDKFPLSGDQLCSILNSDFMNWLFKSIFNTHKVLRGDLEAFPIHADYFTDNPHFDEDSYLDFIHLRKDSNGAYRTKK